MMSIYLFQQLKKIPKPIYLLTMICFIIPFLLEDTYTNNGLREMEFFFLLVPTFFWAYYLGLTGGIFGAILSNTFLLVNEWYEEIIGYTHKLHEIYVIIAIIIINLTISLGIGFLADKLIKEKRKLHNIAITDPLTNLYNRRFVMDGLKELDNDNKVAALFIDIDRFKYINDTLGHEIGDLLLKEFGNRLKTSVKENIIARIGGDEFVVIFKKDVSKEYINRLVEDINKSLSKVFILVNHHIYVNASVGISIYPDNTSSLLKLINNADLAMYHAKKIGNSQVQYYKDEMQKDFFEKAHLEQEIHQAIDNNEFEMYYQPKFNLKTKEIIGMEALIRWEHPEHGVISPMKFIPIAEQTDLIIPIGEWVIRTVCQQIIEWEEKGLNPLCTSINVSVCQFNTSLLHTIKNILKNTNINPKFIEIEITESVLMKNLNESAKIIDELNLLGINTSIDDFGTGYSSLSYLNKLPVHCLKIDKSFINDIKNEVSVVGSIVALGHNLHFDVIAEGVETEDQVDCLNQLDCDYGQGYLISPPVPANEAEILFLEKRLIEIESI